MFHPRNFLMTFFSRFPPNFGKFCSAAEVLFSCRNCDQLHVKICPDIWNEWM